MACHTRFFVCVCVGSKQRSKLILYTVGSQGRVCVFVCVWTHKSKCTYKNRLLRLERSCWCIGLNVTITFYKKFSFLFHRTSRTVQWQQSACSTQEGSSRARHDVPFYREGPPKYYELSYYEWLLLGERKTFRTPHSIFSSFSGVQWRRPLCLFISSQPGSHVSGF